VAPACPMCEHYEGLETTEKGPKVLCAHRFGVQIQSTVRGESGSVSESGMIVKLLSGATIASAYTSVYPMTVD